MDLNDVETKHQKCLCYFANFQLYLVILVLQVPPRVFFLKYD
jgi:hypothetical protein